MNQGMYSFNNDDDVCIVMHNKTSAISFCRVQVTILFRNKFERGLSNFLIFSGFSVTHVR